MTTTPQASGVGSELESIAASLAPFENARRLAKAPEEARASTPMEDVIRTRALKELVEIQQERAVLRATDDGQTQRDIAKALGISQTQVHRILRRARLGETNMRTPVREVILQYRAGVISQGTMIGRLQGAAEGISAESEHDAGFAPDDWDEIRSAYMSSLLTEEEYEALRGSKGRTGSRRRR